jgi:excisionase family DNA binding protein
MLDEPLWTVREVACFLGVSTKTVRAWQYAHRMPFLKIGGTIRFVPEQVQRWALDPSAVAPGDNSFSHSERKLRTLRRLPRQGGAAI